MCFKFTIFGKVQGVGFRWSVQRKAKELGISGYAKNLADGSVEVMAYGDCEKVEALGKWLDEGGPKPSEITNVERSEVDLDIPPKDFVTM